MSRPILLPGGQAVLFGIGFLEFGGVGVLSLENNEVIVVSTDGADPLYSSTGHILFARGNTLFAVPFDVEGFEVTGPAVPVLQGVRVENGGALQVDVSRDGLLVYAPAGAEMGTQLVWVDREGTVESVLDDQWQVFYAPRISPDGKQVAVQINEGGETDIWIHESGTMRLLTTDGVSANPIWTPDGTGVTFNSGSAGSFAIRWTTADGTSEVKNLLSSQFPVFPAAWSPEGNQLVFQEDSSLFVADVGDGGSRTAFLETDFSEQQATLSHSGKWLAYVSDRSGSEEVYVRPFPGPGAEQVISRGGGSEPVWGPDDSELFFRESLSLMVASLQSEPFQVLSREVVFADQRFWRGAYRAHYDIHPDGQRFLMMNMQGSEGTRPKINVVLNWFEELERLVPTEP
jgi:dipeptidyl aminopeptidase/acylaminoacyl peptidase